MPYDVKLPDIGEGVAEGEIVRWLVKPGDAVREDQPLVEVMTDKASVEIPSPRSGVIAALGAQEGQVVPVGSVIVSIALPDESAPSDDAGPVGEEVLRWNDEGGAIPAVAALTSGIPGSEHRAPSPGPSSAPAPAAGRVQATPAVRQLAKELGVALETVRGSGPGGAVTADDVRRAAAAGTASPAAAARAGGTGPPAKGPHATTPVTGLEERVPLKGLRRKIADHMKRSIQSAAHFTFVAECDMTALVEHRASLKPRAERAGVKLTYLAYVLKALIEPLRRHPVLNASLDDEHGEIVLKRYYDIGVATHTTEGLTVPVVRNVDRATLFAVAREIARLSEAARSGHVRLEELQGGTFTVTSTGTRGGVLATPILHYPQVGILGFHEIKKRPAVVGDQIVPRDLCNFSLSLDHRVVDGAVGADFLYELIEELEQPNRWLGEGVIE